MWLPLTVALESAEPQHGHARRSIRCSLSDRVVAKLAFVHGMCANATRARAARAPLRAVANGWPQRAG